MKRAFSKKNLWESTPPALKRLVGVVARVVPPAVFLGSRFRKQLRFVESAQHWPMERIREHQLERMRSICTLAYERTKYYRDTFDRIGFDPRDLRSLEDVTRLPLISKDTLRSHLSQMCTKSPNSPGVDYVSTGGSSGTPLEFYIGAERSSVEYAHLIASWRRVGFELGTPMAVFRGRVIETPTDDRMPYVYDPILRHHIYSNFHMSETNMRRYLEHVRTLWPCYLHVYPSSVAALARYIERTGFQLAHNIRGIIAESENVYPDQRKLCEEVFGCRYFSCYGHSEKLVCAAECEHSTHYHLWPTYGFAELVDENGAPVKTPGARGEIVGTGFINTVAPFIRYRTGDFAQYVADHCASCGRSHLVVDRIRGHRTQEMLMANDGSLISWTAINVHDDTFAHVRQFQFYQDQPGRATLRIAPAATYSHEDREHILRGLRPKLGGRVEVELELCESIPLSARGKAIYVDQRIPEAELSVCNE